MARKTVVGLILLSAFGALFTETARAQGGRQAGPAGVTVRTTLPATPHDFDFTIGKWSVEQVGAGTATDTIKFFGGGIAITEKWVAPNYSGSSVTVFDLTTGKWTQTFYDNQSTYVQQAGGPVGDEIVLVGPSVDAQGNRKLTRLRYLNMSKKSFEQFLESSPDNGGTWVVDFHLIFRKAS